MFAGADEVDANVVRNSLNLRLMREAWIPWYANISLSSLSPRVCWMMTPTRLAMDTEPSIMPTR